MIEVNLDFKIYQAVGALCFEKISNGFVSSFPPFANDRMLSNAIDWILSGESKRSEWFRADLSIADTQQAPLVSRSVRQLEGFQKSVAILDCPQFLQGNARNVGGSRIRACRRQTEMRIKASWIEG